MFWAAPILFPRLGLRGRAWSFFYEGRGEELIKFLLSKWSWAFINKL
jgi:hypothetical protein